MKAAVYCRVSTEDQEREGTSLQSQLETCLRKAQELGYQVPEEFIILETYSGLTLDRPKLPQIRQWVRDKEVEAVIAYTLDRISRDPVHFIILQEELEKAGVELALVTETVDSSDLGKLITYIKGYAAKLEAEKIRERSMRGKRMRAIQGKLPSGAGRKLYGYDYLPGKGIGEGVRYVNEGEAKWVRNMYYWLVEEGLAVNAITRRLRALDVLTPSGSKFWLRQTVYRILTNPAYTGKTYAFTRSYVEPQKRLKPNTRKNTGIRWKPREEWVEIPGVTPPIISEEIFEAAQKILKRNKELASRNAKRQYLLSGYIFCQRCDSRYIGYVRKWKGNGKRYEQRYYRCRKSQSIASPDRCDNKQLHAPTIEAAVWEQIENLLSNPEVVLLELQKKEDEAKKASQQFAHWQNELQGVAVKLRNVEKRKDRAWKAFELTGDEDRFKKDIRQCDEDKKALVEHKASIEQKIEAFEQYQVDIQGIKHACDLVKRNLKSLNFEDKRLALEALQVRVLVDGNNVDIEGAIPIELREFVSSASR